MNKELKETLEDVYKYKSHVIAAGIAIAITLLLTSSEDRLAITMIMGFFTALTAFVGVAYAQDKQNDFLNRQIAADKDKLNLQNRLEKEEEFYLALFSFRHFLLEHSKAYKKYYETKFFTRFESDTFELDKKTYSMRENWYKIKFLQVKFNFCEKNIFSLLNENVTKITRALPDIESTVLNSAKKEKDRKDLLQSEYDKTKPIFKEISELIDKALSNANRQ